MFDTARLARAHGLKNVWVTCGYIQQAPLRELCRYLDGAHVDLKSFDPQVYGRLNSGKLQPILDTLTVLKQAGIWFEIVNLIVPTYTDDLNMIRRMCGWIVDHLGPDHPLHFSRFHPAHKLTNLPPTPIDILHKARAIARQCGLHYVYLGNVPGEDDAETTRCPHCGKAVVERTIYSITANHLQAGACGSCRTRIPGVWTA
jgi:pyruvate formate lyase activating enzyme